MEDVTEKLSNVDDKGDQFRQHLDVPKGDAFFRWLGEEGGYPLNLSLTQHKTHTTLGCGTLQAKRSVYFLRIRNIIVQKKNVSLQNTPSYKKLQNSQTRSI